MRINENFDAVYARLGDRDCVQGKNKRDSQQFPGSSLRPSCNREACIKVHDRVAVLILKDDPQFVFARLGRLQGQHHGESKIEGRRILIVPSAGDAAAEYVE